MHAKLTNLTATQAAKRLLGCKLTRRLDGHVLSAVIVETEAYDQSDAASHSFNGRTQRTDVMFGPAGHLYVYFTYGMHYCCNVVVGPEGYGAAVLIRALQPLEGIDMMQERRGRGGVGITNGPAKLCQAFGIDKHLNGHDLSKPPLQLEITAPIKNSAIVTTTRIGISKAKDAMWRYYIDNNDYVSAERMDQ